MLNEIQKHILEEVADLHTVPTGAYNIRANSAMAGRNTTANIEITTKTDKPGIDIRIKPGTKQESVHIPVVISESGLKEVVYNDFYIGEDKTINVHISNIRQKIKAVTDEEYIETVWGVGFRVAK